MKSSFLMATLCLIFCQIQTVKGQINLPKKKNIPQPKVSNEIVKPNYQTSEKHNIIGSWEGSDGSCLFISRQLDSKDLLIIGSSKATTGRPKWALMGTAKLMQGNGGKQEYLLKWVDMPIGQRTDKGQVVISADYRKLTIGDMEKKFDVLQYKPGNKRLQTFFPKPKWVSVRDNTDDLNKALTKHHSDIGGIWQAYNDNLLYLQKNGSRVYSILQSPDGAILYFGVGYTDAIKGWQHKTPKIYRFKSPTEVLRCGEQKLIQRKGQLTLNWQSTNRAPTTVVYFWDKQGLVWQKSDGAEWASIDWKDAVDCSSREIDRLNDIPLRLLKHQLFKSLKHQQRQDMHYVFPPDIPVNKCVLAKARGEKADSDGDGHSDVQCGGDDCDDSDPNRYPGNPEVCDTEGHDEDCDTDTVGPDNDGDGFSDYRCSNIDRDGNFTYGQDCDDNRKAINPDAIEIPGNNLDENCDGIIE